MNVREQLLVEHSKENTLLIANYIGNNPQRIDELMNLFLYDEYRVCQRAAWVVTHCFENQAHLMQPYLAKVIPYIKGDVHDSVKRNTLKILVDIEVDDEDLYGELIDTCFTFLQSMKEPIAVKAFSMKILGKAIEKYPELKNELFPIIEDQLPYSSAGFKSCAKKILKKK